MVFPDIGYAVGPSPAVGSARGQSCPNFLRDSRSASLRSSYAPPEIFLIMHGRCFSGGNTKDLMTAYDVSAKIAVFDMARTIDQNYFPWNFIENLKNGWFTTTKYKGKLCAFDPPKIIVFTNQMPNKTKLSIDRYDIFVI